MLGGVHIVVGTPGRLRDHIERGALDVSALKIVVLDEADEMLDLGFREELEFMLEAMPVEKRSLLFSATVPKGIATLARGYQRDAMRIEVERGKTGHADIEYRAIRIYPQESEAAVVNLLRFVESPTAIVFCNTREAVRQLGATLAERGFSAVTLSGELSQHERNHAMQALRNGRARVLVATDVAARGIDLPNVGIVIHADLPARHRDVAASQRPHGARRQEGRQRDADAVRPPQQRRAAVRRSGHRAIWMGPPTAAEVRALDAERFLADPALVEPAGDDDLAMARQLLEKRSPEEIAAALVKLYRARLPAIEDVSDPGERGRETRARPVYSERPAPRGRVAPEDRDYSNPKRSGGKHGLGGGAGGVVPARHRPRQGRRSQMAAADDLPRGRSHQGRHRNDPRVRPRDQIRNLRRRGGKIRGRHQEARRRDPRIEPMGPSSEGGGAPRVGGKPDKRTRMARKGG